MPKSQLQEQYSLQKGNSAAKAGSQTRSVSPEVTVKGLPFLP